MLNPTNSTNFSFWETQQYFRDLDLIVVGSGIVGLNAALSYKNRFPEAKVLVLERGILPQGASTKNAGFACFGSVSELLSDLKSTNEDLVWQTVEMRIKGLELLREILGDRNIDYQENGGYELFSDLEKFESCADKIKDFNYRLQDITLEKETYQIATNKIENFNFNGIKGLILNKKEGQIDTGKMMKSLLELAICKGVTILNSVNVTDISDAHHGVFIESSIGNLVSRQAIIATNGFAAELLKGEDVKPARAQVLVTKPIRNLKLKGTFHYDEGFYYFRNIGQRVLFGGGRNLDFQTEQTTVFKLNQGIHQQLDQLLQTMILPDVDFEIEQRWSGIMGVGNEKKPIVKRISPNIVCAVRMGGMGVAIGSLVGQMAVKELHK